MKEKKEEEKKLRQEERETIRRGMDNRRRECAI